jgi:hypothetical protein
MLVALRVLGAINEKKAPDAIEVQALRDAAREDQRDLPIDLLACATIKREIEAKGSPGTRKRAAQGEIGR